MGAISRYDIEYLRHYTGATNFVHGAHKKYFFWILLKLGSPNLRGLQWLLALIPADNLVGFWDQGPHGIPQELEILYK